jgi:hypothetical protein
MRLGDSQRFDRAIHIEGHEIAPEFVEQELRSASFTTDERVDELIPHAEEGRFDTLVVASRPTSG